jgi:hypothetical protein
MLAGMMRTKPFPEVRLEPKVAPEPPMVRPTMPGGVIVTLNASDG